MNGEPLTLPPECLWPECLYCDQPVTEHQQAIGAAQVFEGAGVAHRKCVKAAEVKLEAQMVRA